MGLIHEPFIRCGCGNAEFEEKVIVTIDKNAKSRDALSKGNPLPTLERHIRYVCTKCGQPLDK